MAAAQVSNSIQVGDDCKEYASSGSPRDLVADSPSTKKCARRIYLKAASTTLTVVGRKGVSRVLTGLPAGYLHDCHCQSITSDVAFVAYW